jgi:hypothetical protein
MEDQVVDLMGFELRDEKILFLQQTLRLVQSIEEEQQSRDEFLAREAESYTKQIRSELDKTTDLMNEIVQRLRTENGRLARQRDKATAGACIFDLSHH